MRTLLFQSLEPNTRALSPHSSAFFGAFWQTVSHSAPVLIPTKENHLLLGVVTVLTPVAQSV